MADFNGWNLTKIFPDERIMKVLRSAPSADPRPVKIKALSGLAWRAPLLFAFIMINGPYVQEPAGTA
jgi:hypothetical protein